MDLAALAGRDVKGVDLSRRVLVGVPARWLRAAAGAFGFTVVAFLLTLRLGAAGLPMDEGAVLAYSDRVLHGAVPMRDFQTFYGPANVWLVAGASRVFGAGLGVERAVGLGYHVAVVGALLVLVRRRGPGVILATALVLALVLPGQGVWAYSASGALACALVAVALADTGRPGAAGLLAGIAVLMRFDWAPAVLLGLAPFLAAWTPTLRRRAAAGFAAGVAAYLPFAVAVGPRLLEQTYHQLRASGAGRHLPFPLLRIYPGYLVALGAAAVLLVVAAGVHGRRHVEGRALIGVGLLSAGLLPFELSRLDASHIVVCTVAATALLPAATVSLGGAARRRYGPTAVKLVGAAALLVVLVVGQGQNFYYLLSPLFQGDQMTTYRVSNEGRSFLLDDGETAADVRLVLAEVDRVARTGDRVFVGPEDLSRTNYTDTYLYYLLPRLKPASYYMELNPLTANEPGSGLTRQLATADVLILTSRYDRWREPNASRLAGSPAPTLLVRRSFCERAGFGTYRVLTRCLRRPGR